MAAGIVIRCRSLRIPSRFELSTPNTLSQPTFCANSSAAKYTVSPTLIGSSLAASQAFLKKYPLIALILEFPLVFMVAAIGLNHCSFIFESVIVDVANTKHSCRTRNRPSDRDTVRGNKDLQWTSYARRASPCRFWIEHHQREILQAVEAISESLFIETEKIKKLLSATL